MVRCFSSWSSFAFRSSRPVSRFSLLVPSLSLLAILIAIAPFARAQVAGPPAAQAATVAALAHYPDFYVNRSVSVRGRFTGAGASLALQDEAGNQVRAAWKDAARPDGVVDAYGTLWDLGRMTRDDPRLGGYDLTPWLGTGGEWPRPGDVYVFGIGRVQPAQAGEGDSIRAITLDGLSASGRRVTIVGQFRGRNLFGDLPRAPGVTRWEFVLTATGSAIWVSGMPPKGKEFDLDLNSRADSNVWLRVSGTVRERNGLMWIEPASVDEAKPSPWSTRFPRRRCSSAFLLRARSRWHRRRRCGFRSRATSTRGRCADASRLSTSTCHRIRRAPRST